MLNEIFVLLLFSAVFGAVLFFNTDGHSILRICQLCQFVMMSLSCVAYAILGTVVCKVMCIVIFAVSIVLMFLSVLLSAVICVYYCVAGHQGVLLKVVNKLAWVLTGEAYNADDT